MKKLIWGLLGDLFKSRATKKIEAAIVKQTELIAWCESEKVKYLKDSAMYAKIWAIQKDYQRNIDLLKGLL